MRRDVLLLAEMIDAAEQTPHPVDGVTDPHKLTCTPSADAATKT